MVGNLGKMFLAHNCISCSHFFSQLLKYTGCFCRLTLREGEVNLIGQCFLVGSSGTNGGCETITTRCSILAGR